MKCSGSGIYYEIILLVTLIASNNLLLLTRFLLTHHPLKIIYQLFIITIHAVL